MNRLFLTAVFALLTSVSALQAQIVKGGTPISFDILYSSELPAMEPIGLPAVDEAALLAEDAVNDQYKEIPWRFGYNHEVDLGLEDGKWTTLSNGDRVWQLMISSNGARSLNLQFDLFWLPEGTELFIYTPDHQNVLGAITSRNNKEDLKLGTTLIPGSTVILEYREPLGTVDDILLHISTVTHGYRDVVKHARGLGDSGNCNNNVVCPVGLPWDQQIRSVAMIVVGGNGICTGAMINNTCNDQRPFFLTADHCLFPNVSNWVFLFNWESPSCDQNISGPVDQTVSGATLRASNSDSDVALLELSTSPPNDYEVFYAGWDNTGNGASSTVGIHHPAGDIKKISFDNDPVVSTTSGGMAVWRVINWEDGTTEGGSSGSPLFNPDGRIIGQLFGGSASCQSITNDFYGRFDVSWSNGNNASTRLSDWLDDCDQSVTILDGLDTKVGLDASILDLLPEDSILCDSNFVPSIVLRNTGQDLLTSATINYSVDGAPSTTINWTGNLSAGAVDTIYGNTIAGVGSGAHTLFAEVLNPNGGTDQNANNNSRNAGFHFSEESRIVSLFLGTDFFASQVSWEVRTSDNQTTLFSGGGYPDGVDTFQHDLCLDTGCYNFIIRDDAGNGLGAGANGFYEFVDQDSVLLSEPANDFNTLKVASFCVTTMPEDTMTDGLNELANSFPFTVFPNPARDQVSLRWQHNNGPLEITVLNNVGQVVKQQVVVSGQREVTLQTQTWPAGIYQVLVRGQKEFGREKVLILR